MHALYIHCCAHNLNLVLADSCKNCVAAVTFFGTIQKIYILFIKSTLSELPGGGEKEIKDDSEEIKLKRQSETR